MNHVLLASLTAVTLLSAGCSSTTTRSDVRDARENLRDARDYGDRDDRREARRELRRTERDYARDHQCGPDYGGRADRSLPSLSREGPGVGASEARVLAGSR